MTLDPATTSQIAENVTKLVLHALMAVIAIWWGFFRKRKGDTAPNAEEILAARKRQLRALLESEKQRPPEP